MNNFIEIPEEEYEFLSAAKPNTLIVERSATDEGTDILSGSIVSIGTYGSLKVKLSETVYYSKADILMTFKSSGQMKCKDVVYYYKILAKKGTLENTVKKSSSVKDQPAILEFRGMSEI